MTTIQPKHGGRGAAFVARLAHCLLTNVLCCAMLLIVLQVMTTMQPKHGDSGAGMTLDFTTTG